MVTKQQTFNKICKDIKSVKIQGARKVAKAAFRAYKLVPTSSSKKRLLALRPTEPLLHNILKIAEDYSYKEFLNKLENNQKKINKNIFKLVKKNDIVFTHCHSSTVVKALIYCKKKGKRFEVYNTETRPLFQGRKTARELKKANIPVTMFVDSAVNVALTQSQGTKKADIVLFGVDAIIHKQGVINKIGSNLFAQIAKINKIPVYAVADSWKYSSKNIKIEQRSREEVWDTDLKIQIRNPAFGLIKRKYITGIISEFGTLPYKKFIKEVRKS